VLANFRKHARRAVPRGIDSFSSAGWFDGFREWRPRVRDGSTTTALGPPWVERAPPPFPRTSDTADDARWVVLAPREWLTRVGWRRLGLVGLGESPASLRDVRET
jgi:hypothetical protein